ncbi:unnamed protein product [Malus baccata var. baccata]
MFCSFRRIKGILHIPLAIPTPMLCQLGLFLIVVLDSLRILLHYGSYIVVISMVAGESLAAAGCFSKVDLGYFSLCRLFSVSGFQCRLN